MIGGKMEGERWIGKEKERKTETERGTERMTQGVEDVQYFKNYSK